MAMTMKIKSILEVIFWKIFISSRILLAFKKLKICKKTKVLKM
jgi:hypothetical protein